MHVKKSFILGAGYSFVSHSETEGSTLISLLLTKDRYFDNTTLRADGNARNICRRNGDTVNQCISSLAALRYMDFHSRIPQTA